jgi:chromosome segregation ATPase
LCVLLLAFCALPLSAAELFRYRNSEGVVVLANTIPAQYATQGYTVLDHRGRVLRVVPRQLSASEIVERDAELAAEREAEAERMAQRQEDEELLRLYSTPDDVERALQRQLESIEGAIDTVEANIQRLGTQKRNLQVQAAEIERSGKPIPLRIISGLRSLDDQIAEKQREIEAREAEILATRQDYAADRERLRVLLGLSDDV